jgi:hypothetical protein
MEFIKRNIFLLACILAVLASAGVGFLGCGRVESVRNSMGQATELGNQVSAAGTIPNHKQPVALPDLVVQEENIKKVQGKLKETQDRILDMNRGAAKLDYILDEAFPDPKDRPNIHYEFVKRYREAVNGLARILAAKGPPTAADEERAKAAIEEENEQLGLTTEKRTPAAPTPATPAATPAPRRPERDRGGNTGLAAALAAASKVENRPAPALRGAERRPAADTGDHASTRPVDSRELLRTDPRRRAEIARAQEIRTYIASDNPADTFTVVQPALDVNSAPTASEMWHAQMTLWIQREICQALAQVNDAAAADLKKANRPVNVTTLPVKELMKLLVGEYRAKELPTGEGAAGRGGGGGQPPPRAGREPSERKKDSGGFGAALGGLAGTARTPARTAAAAPAAQETTTSLQAEVGASTWTGRISGGDLDVVPVGIRLIIDLRALPQVIDQICRKNFYVPTRVNYRRLERSELKGAFVYGADPVVEVTLLFERYFLPRIYDEKMPSEVKVRLGHPLEEAPPGTPRKPGPRGG